MKLRLLVLAATLVLGPLGFAQMTYSYSSYIADPATDHTYLYESVVVDGSATCSSNIFEHINCSSIYHQGRVYVQIGNAGSWTYGQDVCPGCYISQEGTQAVAYTPGDDYTVSAEGAVFCSGAGGLVYTYFLKFGGGVSVGNYQWNGLPPLNNICQFNLQCPIPTKATCGPGTYYEKAQGGGCGPHYREAYTGYYVTGAGTHCSPIGFFVTSDTPVNCK